MPLIIAAALKLWAWVLPFAAPVLAKAGILVAGARSWFPRGAGANVAAVAVLGLLAAFLVWRVHRWIDPPPRTYTAAEIAADRLQRELTARQEALEARERAIKVRELVAAKVELESSKLEGENDERRKQANDLDKASGGAGPRIVFGDNDPWLQLKRARAGIAAGAAGDGR